ncbi:MAG: hypothetical protein C5B54_06195 [Acidobacteria bacterium]|nr:MAG: hypothetical protein C5B54_06195 [Acidobacteriota bacterium]
MKDYKKLLTSFIEVVTFLFASFGGFLKKIAPPDQVGASYPVGIMSFLMLIILLAISAIGRQAATKTAFKRWISAGIVLFILALPACFLYPYMLSHYTYPQQSELVKRRIGASDEYLTPDARQYRAANPNASSEELDRNLPDGDVWAKAGLERTELRLLVAYACLVLSLSGAIFCLLEANIGLGANRSARTSRNSSSYSVRHASTTR